MSVEYLSYELDLVGIDVSSPHSFPLPSSLTHDSLYPDLFDESNTSMMSSNPLYFYVVGPNCNHVHDDMV